MLTVWDKAALATPQALASTWILDRLLATIAARPPARVRIAHRPLLVRWRQGLAEWLKATHPVGPLAAAGMLAAVAVSVSLVATRTESAAPGFHVSIDTDVPEQDDAAELYIVFAAGAGEDRREALLASIGGRIVDGPRSARAVMVRVPPTAAPVDYTALLHRLRQRPEVAFAEAVRPLALPPSLGKRLP